MNTKTPKALNIDKYSNIDAFLVAFKVTFKREEYQAGLKKTLNLYNHFEVSDISLRCKSLITKQCDKKTFTSVRKYWTKHEIYKMAVSQLGKTLTTKCSSKFFKSYGIIMKKPQENVRR